MFKSGKLMMKQALWMALLICVKATATGAAPQADELFAEKCASCHGADLSGGMAGSLLDETWLVDGTTETLARIISEGATARGMPAWGNSLSPAEVRSLVIYIAEQRHNFHQDGQRDDTRSNVLTSMGHTFRIDTLHIADEILWAVEYLPDGSMLVTRRDGALLHISASGKLIEAVKGLPEIWHHVQGGLLDITLHPDYKNNGWIYLAYASTKDGKKGNAKIARGKIKDGYWIEHQDIFEADVTTHTDSGRHFGSRIIVHNGYVYFSTGDRGDRPSAQDLDSPNGKIFRLHENGGIPEDNPFVDADNALPGIWSYGHRNPQGMAIEANTGLIWETEHGPRGGDELNVIRRGINYGWPEITYGMNYDGTPITHETAKEGMEQPKHYWVPSIAPAGMAFYTGDMFTKWKDKLLVGGLGIQDLQMYSVENGEVISSDIILTDRGRIRDISVAPDGSILLVVTIDGKGHILTLAAQ
ncbi:secretion protein HlyD [Pseudomaricurvus alcaniphilus]|uniref:PQQ-dependent sugar dehydrogenase n=1 Tax=Pseudomaricurvus alcaniphilus TaxID=1166482 RepID=UPI001409FF43|nr:PQQ-dependent sugar dehydrogenase [Pseudomaricurvus alcaniphilus]NHN39854.1 secretion protein HlyD [Pseudomaricurvus alcaniphilus]